MLGVPPFKTMSGYTRTSGDLAQKLAQQLEIDKNNISLLTQNIVRIKVSEPSEGARVWRRWVHLNPPDISIIITLPGTEIYLSTLQEDIKNYLDYLR